MTAYNVRVSVSDPDALIAGSSPFANFEAAKIQLYRWTTEALARAGSAGAGTLVATFDLVASTEPITENEGPYSFAYYDSGAAEGHWYRYRFADESVAQFSQWSTPWQVSGRARTLLRDLIVEIGRMMGDSVRQGTATNGSATTATCTALFKSSKRDTRFYEGQWFAVTKDAGGAGATPENEEALITSVDSSTGVATLERDLSAAIANGDQFIVSALMQPSDMIACINRAREGMKVLRAVDIALSTNERLYPVPVGVRTRADVYEVLGVDQRSPGNIEEEYPVLWDIASDGPQLWLRLFGDSDGLPFVRFRYEQSYRDFEGLMSLYSDSTVAPLEWLRVAAAYECVDALTRDDPEEPTFSAMLQDLAARLATATGRYAEKMPARRAKATRQALPGPARVI